MKKFFYFLGLIIGWGIFFWQLITGIKSLIQNQVVLVSPIPIIVSLLVMLGYIGIQVVNWQFIFKSFGGRLGWSDIARGYSFSSIARYIPGTVWGYISRSEWLFRNYQIPYKLSGAASITEVIASVTSAFLTLGIVGIVIQRATHGIGLVGALCIPVFVWILSERFVKIKEFKIWHKKFPNPTIHIPLKAWVASHLIFFLQWLIYGYVTWLLIGVLRGGAFFSDNIIPGILNATFAFTLAWLIGFLILFIPGGLGVRELILTFLLGQFFNITEDQCLLVAIGLRILYSLAEMVWTLGGISWKKELKS